MPAAPAPIAGRYRLERRLGVGGMSTVQLAFDERLERYVAVKLLAEHLADDPSFVSRFRREALAAARLVHPNVVQVFDFGFDEDSTRHFIVMEQIRGKSCAELLRDRKQLGVEETVDIISQACQGLEYAHRNGVIHRDVKPGNLLVSDEGTVKLADFGIAKAAEQSSITQVGSVLGTAAYLAPEQARGEEAGPAADLYSLGVVSYQLLSGTLPYQATSLSELALKQQSESPAPLDALRGEVPGALASAVAMTLALDPRDRPSDALEFGEILRGGLRGEEPPGYDEETHALGGDETEATAMLRRDRTGAVAPVVQRLPRREQGYAPATTPPRRRREPAPPRARRRSAAAPARPAKRPKGRIRRGLRLVVLLLVLLAGGAAAIIATSGTQRAVDAREIVGDNVSKIVDDMRRLIDDNTQ